MTQDLDVVVVGGGPVGLVSALFAAEAGLRVVVVEPRLDPIDKACGEGLMPTALSLLRDLQIEPAGRPYVGITYIDVAGGQRAEASFSGAPGRGVRRTVLHEELTRRAKELEVEQRQGRVVVLDQSTECVETRLLDGTQLQSRYLIAADGLHSTVRGLVRLAKPAAPHVRFGLRSHFEVQPWSDNVEVYWADHAEAYVTPVAANLVGVALLGERKGGDFASRLEEFPALNERLGDVGAIGPVLGAGPLRQDVVGRVRGRVLLVGDAAGYVDALTGEGLAIGFTSARAAVTAIVTEQPQSYEREWRQITWRYRWLTHALLRATRHPMIRNRLVPAAAGLPRVFRAAVNSLA
jgi:flavin-dependent dehydrogenase